MPVTVNARNEMLDAYVAAAGTLYITLIRTGGTEASGTGYARLPVSWNAAAGGVKDNDTQVQFNNGGENDWPSDIDKWKVYDALVAGNEVSSGTLSENCDMSAGTATVTFAVGDIDLTLTTS